MKKSFAFLGLLFAMSVFALEPITVENLTTKENWKIAGKVVLNPIEDPEVGKAIQCSNFPTGNAILKVPFNNEQLEALDQYQGISFKIKGDGSDCWASISVINPLYTAYAYQYLVPLKSTEWVTYKLAWSELSPEYPYGAIGTSDGMPPCGLTGIRVGNRWDIWYDNAKIPPFSFAIADFKYEPVVAKETHAYVPATLQDFIAKLNAKEPVTIQCMGDSITAGTSLRNKLEDRYSKRIQNLLREKYEYEDITVWNRAVGGAGICDERVWLNRDFSLGTPDLVTIWIGYNDRFRIISKEAYKRAIAKYVDMVIEKTQGKSAIVLFATGPGKNEGFTMMDLFADVIREVAAEKNLALFDINKIFKAFGRRQFSEKYMADAAHPNPEGHKIIATSFCDFLINYGK